MKKSVPTTVYTSAVAPPAHKLNVMDAWDTTCGEWYLWGGSSLGWMMDTWTPFLHKGMKTPANPKFGSIWLYEKTHKLYVNDTKNDWVEDRAPLEINSEAFLMTFGGFIPGDYEIQEDGTIEVLDYSRQWQVNASPDYIRQQRLDGFIESALAYDGELREDETSQQGRFAGGKMDGEILTFTDGSESKYKDYTPTSYINSVEPHKIYTRHVSPLDDGPRWLYLQERGILRSDYALKA